ncbi:dihydroorotase family protein [Streptomyces stramineus]
MSTPDRTTAPAAAGYDLVVTGARVVTPQGVLEGGVAVSEGRIAAVLGPGETPAAARTIDAEGRYLLPGVIDSHVHFRTPGLLYKEDWEHGSRAAAAGGVTTVIDMPNTQPPLIEPDDAAAKAAMIDGKSLVDYRFHFGVTEDSIDNLYRLQPRQATSVKVFMTGHHTAPHVIRDPQALDRIFAIAAERGIRLVLHAEDDGVFALLDDYLGEPEGYDAYEPSRPRSGGIVAAARVVELVRRHGTSVHIVHVSSSEESVLLRAANRAGLPITFEVTSHHLSFSASDTQRLGARIRLSPAIRSLDDQRDLWNALLEGGVATIGSDHAPHTVEEKSRSVQASPPGLPGVQELLTAVFTGMRRRHPELSTDELMTRIAQVGSAQPGAVRHRRPQGADRGGPGRRLHPLRPRRGLDHVRGARPGQVRLVGVRGLDVHGPPGRHRAPGRSDLGRPRGEPRLRQPHRHLARRRVERAARGERPGGRAGSGPRARLRPGRAPAGVARPAGVRAVPRRPRPFLADPHRSHFENSPGELGLRCLSIPRTSPVPWPRSPDR